MASQRTLALSWEQRQELETHRDHDPRPYVRERCAALLKIAQGNAPYWVARHGLLKRRQPDTVYRWLARYQKEGLAGLLAHRQGGNRRGGFDREQEEAIVHRLHQPPGEEARREAGATASSPPPSRWTLRTIRVSVPELADYSLSGIWRVLHRCRLRLRTARLQLYSPDPDYLSKVARLERCLRQAARDPDAVALVFVDEMGYYRWPDAARDWMRAAPDAPTLARRAGPTNRQQRLIGALNALTGRVDYRDNYLVGREQVIAFYRQLDRVYAGAERVYVVQDNWSIHHHDDVQAALADLPRLEMVWLPTYAPWLNPIEKLWRWLRQDVLKLHRLADDWPVLRQRVNAFLDQFARGSHQLLRYTGLIGDGHLAYALRSA